MAEGRYFSFSIVTPEKVEAEGKADFLTLPGFDGEFGVMYDRAPLLVRLSPGLVRLRADDHERWYFVAGGFAQVIHNEVTILTPRSATRKEIQAGDIDAARERARGLKAPDDAGLRRMHDAHAEVHALQRLSAHGNI